MKTKNYFLFIFIVISFSSTAQNWRLINSENIFEIDTLFFQSKKHFIEKPNNQKCLITIHDVDEYWNKENKKKYISIVTSFDSNGVIKFTKVLDINFKDFLVDYQNHKYYLVETELNWLRRKTIPLKLIIYDTNWTKLETRSLRIPKTVKTRAVQNGIKRFKVDKYNRIWIQTDPFVGCCGLNSQNLQYTYNLLSGKEEILSFRDYEFKELIVSDSVVKSLAIKYSQYGTWESVIIYEQKTPDSIPKFSKQDREREHQNNHTIKYFNPARIAP